MNFVNICMLKYINMNCCEMTYCISYALGNPRTVGVSACDVFGGLTHN